MRFLASLSVLALILSAATGMVLGQQPKRPTSGTTPIQPKGETTAAGLRPAPLPACQGEPQDSATAASAVQFRAWLTKLHVAAETDGEPVYGAQEWDFGDGSAKATEVNPSHAYTGAGSYLWSVRIRGNGRGCQLDWIVAVRPAVDADRVIKSAVQELLGDLKGGVSRELRGAFKATARYPLRIVLTDAIPGAPPGEENCMSEEVTMKMLDDQLGDDVVLPSDSWTRIDKMGFRLEKGHYLCTGEMRVGAHKVRFVSGSLEDRGEIKYERGARVAVDGKPFEYDGASWKSGDTSKPATESAANLVQKISHLPSLVELAKRHTDADVRSAALDLTRDQAALEEIARGASDENIAVKALDRISQRTALSRVLASAESDAVREAAKQRIAALPKPAAKKK